ncbi:MAG: hypothetical protein ACXAB7_01565 [Candidatus Kariarchaeaceae archaeon]|jgi:hypothetical protein
MEYLLHERVLVFVVIFLFVTFPLRKAKRIILEHSESINQPNSYGQPLLTQKGEVVRSNGEQLIANYLFQNRIAYQYESTIKGMLTDFYLLDHHIAVEYWGMVHVKGDEGKKYRENMKYKMVKYQTFNIPLISLYPKELKRLDSVFPAKLNAYCRYFIED